MVQSFASQNFSEVEFSKFESEFRGKGAGGPATVCLDVQLLHYTVLYHHGVPGKRNTFYAVKFEGKHVRHTRKRVL